MLLKMNDLFIYRSFAINWGLPQC